MKNCEKAESILGIIEDEDFKKLSLAFYLDSEIADTLTDLLLDRVPLFYEDTEADVMNVLDNNDVVVIAINRYDDGKEELFVDALLHKGVQYYNEADVIFIQDELLDVVEIDKLNGEIAVLYEDDDEIEDECNDTEEFIDDMMEELLYDIDNLNGNGCVHCLIKSYLLDMYETGYQDGIRDSIEQLENNLKEQF